MAHRMAIVGSSMAILGASLALGGPTASAASVTAARAADAPETPQMPGVPSGYVVVHTALLTASAGAQTHASVDCPPARGGVAREPQGGGVGFNSNDVGANVNSSYPSGISWQADLNNNSGSDATFEVFAVCAKPKMGYTVVTTAGIFNPAGTQTSGFAGCPTGTRILGGGALSSSSSVLVNTNSSYPVSNGWRGVMNNGSAANTSFSVYAVCSKYPASTGYTIVAGTPTNNPAGVQTGVAVNCPTGTSSLGGGMFASSTSTAVNINTTIPLTGGWLAYESNGSGSDETITPFVVCAG